MNQYILDLLHNATFSTHDIVWLAHINQQGDAREVLASIKQLHEAGEISGDESGWERVYQPVKVEKGQRMLAGME